MAFEGPERGVSPVVGVVLLVAIMLLLAVVTGGIFLGLGDRLKEPAPLFASDGGRVDVGVSNGAITSQDLVLAHRGGQTLDVSKVEVLLDDGNGSYRLSPPLTGDLSDGTWSAGEEMSIPVDHTQVCDGTGTLDVRLVHTGETSYVVSETSVPLVEGGFTVEGGSLVPVSGYSAEATVLGTGFTYGAGGPNIDIRLDVVIGNTSYDPWPGNVNNNGNPRSHTFTNQPAGAAISVAATGDENGVYIAPRTRWSNASTGWVYVLRDGDTPPNIGAFGDQDSAASYVAPYLDGAGNIDLADNEAIFLFELGNSQTGSAADFQDVVVLVSLQTEQVAAVQQGSSGQHVVVCPGG